VSAAAMAAKAAEWHEQCAAIVARMHDNAASFHASARDYQGTETRSAADLADWLRAELRTDDNGSSHFGLDQTR
jgi:hypothetical protein